ncbi:MAG: (Fe-S)-binding protein [Deltaproteobacteria bacterium]|nr:(Fe-S)-binding protein [Deltaproteobacteria bacterium]
MPIIHPATESYFGIPGYVFGWGLIITALSAFSYTMYKRYLLIRSGQPDPRLADIGKRLVDVFIYGIIQKRQPRYPAAGIIHILIFWGFIVLGLRSIDLVSQGLNLPFLQPIMKSGFGTFYSTLKDIFELVVLSACLCAVYRRWITKPKRYEGSHQGEAFLVLGLISFLMVTDMLYEGSALRVYGPGHLGAGWFPAARLGALVVAPFGAQSLQKIYPASYWLHVTAFFFFLNFLPLGKHFHIITALPNVFLRKREKGTLKPARWGVDDLEELETCGVGIYEDFTWKHLLDFFTCTECGRCTDNCPANTSGRPLSPKLITINLRDYGYRKYRVFPFTKLKEQPLKSNDAADSPELLGDVVTTDEIWSCTTCGACEEECPVFIEYIDKIIDMRRHLIETSQNPHVFNKVLMNVETTGNPFGKPPEKRAEWIQDLEDIPVKILDEGDAVDVLFYVDSYGAFDHQAQAVAAAIAKGLHLAGIDFGILGELEKDSGHQVRRMGEEGLFQFLVEENMETLSSIRFNRIITTDPHCFNTLKKDYPADFKVYHYAEFFAALAADGRLRPSKTVEYGNLYTFHDPCYLGRHNEIYDAPRQLLRSIPGLRLVEMERSKDRSFCCGGGDIILWHEIEQEEIRMAELRIKMALEIGADVIVTACPFCFTHFDDAVKTAGLENEMKVIDLMGLFLSAL